MKIQTMATVDVEVEVDVSLDEMFAECGRRANEAAADYSRRIIEAHAFMLGIMTRMETEIIDAIQPAPRAIIHEHLSMLAARWAPTRSSDLLKDMDQPALREHLACQLRFIKASQTPDTVGSMLIIFGDDGISQYGATIDPETAPQALRELADRIEKRSMHDTVKP